MAVQTIYEFNHFCVTARLLPARSGPGHFGHPGWLSKPYMKLIIFMYQLASCPPDLDLAILDIPDIEIGAVWNTEIA